MKKVLLDFSKASTKEETQEYIATMMEFPDYYGKNLDALYDMLTSLAEPTAVGIFLPIADMTELDIDLMVYFDRVGEVFAEAEEENPNLAVIFGDLIMNPEYESEFDGDDYDDYFDPDGVAGVKAGRSDTEDEEEDDDGVDDEVSPSYHIGERDIIFLDPTRHTP